MKNFIEYILNKNLETFSLEFIFKLTMVGDMVRRFSSLSFVTYGEVRGVFGSIEELFDCITVILLLLLLLDLLIASKLFI